VLSGDAVDPWEKKRKSNPPVSGDAIDLREKKRKSNPPMKWVTRYAIAATAW
jgi:hypothetical protein